ncbi:hypothetical protein MLD38_007154 [Melastoma candidum]|uniref:Uncharacterized protein n=1 Tax=Melastoma candidum TaxID=119954 RepID=A0ACB9RT78_9MYRT|nr:hypothetical protein MLD38_007154 [Melastoma candidum]
MPMSVPLYSTPASTVCSPSHPIASHAHPPFDAELNPRPSSSAPKPALVGGLSSLFASPGPVLAKGSPAAGFGDELGGSRIEKGDEFRELGSSFRYSGISRFIKKDWDYHSPVSVFTAPASCGSSIGCIGSFRKDRDHLSSSSVLSGSVSANSSCVGSSCLMGGLGRIGRDGSGDSNSLSSNRSGYKGLFDGFVGNAVASCVDVEVEDEPISVNGVYGGMGVYGVNVDELTFDLEDSFVESDVEPYVKELLASAQRRHKIFCDEFVIKAFFEAEKAHRGQVRASGDPYLQHCVETAVLLALIGANATVVAAGLLHDTLDDTVISNDYLLRTFGAGVADLVKGVSKLSELSHLARENNIATKTVEADRLHTMFLAMADARAVLIKLADRLHNMMTLDSLPSVKQQRVAKETLEIFAPLANRLGIYSWKEQLENLCFRHLHPEMHKELSAKQLESFDEAMITSSVEKLQVALKDHDMSYHSLSGRHKSLYSVYRKMSKKNVTMNNIHDMHGIRLILDNEEDCYKALEIVHKLWSKVSGQSKDYIKNPKINGYQSLHTVVLMDGLVPLEVQIRTRKMHLQAEFGFAAHWRYKEGDCKHSSFVLGMVEWARWVVSWQCEAMRKDRLSIGQTGSTTTCSFPTHAEDCPFAHRPHTGHNEPVFVIMIENDEMSVQELPPSSTMMDLMERARVRGFSGMPYRYPFKEEPRVKLNHEPVFDPTCKLKMGDIVELTPALPDKSLVECREEIQRMYDRGTAVSGSRSRAKTGAGWTT